MNELVIKPLGTVSPYCYDEMNCSGYLVTYNDQKYLLDAGNGISRYIDFPNDLENLKVLITHLHPDHFEELSVLCQSAYVFQRLGMLKSKLEIFIPFSKDEINKTLIAYSFIHSLEDMYPVKVIDYDNLNIKDHDLEITSLGVSHQVTANAFRLETSAGVMVYSGDTDSQNNLREFSENADLLICESTYLQGQIRMTDTHLYASEAGKIAYDSHVKKLLLTHFWPHLSKELYVSEAKKYFKNTEAAYENKKLILRK